MNKDYYNIMRMFAVNPDNTPEHVTAYHLTSPENAAKIRREGITARSSIATKSGEGRRPAAYLFAARADAYDKNIRSFLFGDKPAEVVTVSIPRAELEKLEYDGLFNMSCICADGSYPTAILYPHNIPAEWINQ